jgi:hypothetical protein
MLVHIKVHICHTFCNIYVAKSLILAKIKFYLVKNCFKSYLVIFN